MTANVLRSLFGLAAPAAPDEGAWTRVCARTSLLDGLADDERARLRALAGEFLRTKSIEPVGDVELDEDLRVAIALQACLPVLNLGLDWYDGVRTVLVYPGDFVARQEYTDEAGVVHHLERPLSGEAWPEGPVILSLEGVLDGIEADYADNLVIHEMAHKLDLSNGVANGMPALHVGMQREAWTDAFSAAYEHLCRRVQRRQDPVFDAYACEDPGEFFAVMSEAFFLEPALLADVYPDVYRQFTLFYRQDPRARSTAAET